MKRGTITRPCISTSQSPGSTFSIPIPVSISSRRSPITSSTSSPLSCAALPMPQWLNSLVANGFGASSTASAVTTAISTLLRSCSAWIIASIRASASASITPAVSLTQLFLSRGFGMSATPSTAATTTVKVASTRRS